MHADVQIALVMFPVSVAELSLSLTDMDRNVEILKRIAGRAYRRLCGLVDYEDLLQFAWLGLLEARSRFEPIAGVPFGAYAHRRVNGAIFDGMGRMTGMSRGRLRTLRNAVDAESDTLVEDDEGGAATDGEESLEEASHDAHAQDFAQTMEDHHQPPGADDRRTWWVRAYAAPRSWDKLCRDTAEISPVPLFGKPPACPEELAIRGQFLERLREVFHRIDRDDQDLLRALYYDETSTRELGERFQVSSASISRRHLRILNHLRRCVGRPARRPTTRRRRRRQSHGA